MAESRESAGVFVTDQDVRFNVLNHVNVPRHEILPADEVKALLKRFAITKDMLPKIRNTDAAIQPLFKAAGLDEAERVGQVVKVTRNSPTAGLAIAYRLVTEAI